MAAVADALGKHDEAAFFRARAFSAPWTLFNIERGFMEARTADGAWAGADVGWTEGDMWAYTLDVLHDVGTLIERKGGNASFVRFLDEHFDGGECVWSEAHDGCSAYCGVWGQGTMTIPTR